MGTLLFMEQDIDQLKMSIAKEAVKGIMEGMTGEISREIGLRMKSNGLGGTDMDRVVAREVGKLVGVRVINKWLSLDNIADTVATQVVSKAKKRRKERLKSQKKEIDNIKEDGPEALKMVEV